MADKLNITRRDFLGGVALSLAAGTSLSPLEILAMESKSSYYPPLLTGLRGSHTGSFEIAHAVARSGARFERPNEQTDATYDLVVAGGGFDAERDIAAITINRWPHGYAYEYNDLFDSPDYNPNNGPHIAGRAQISRISIANSDASAYAYVNGAIDAADRAVSEQIAIG